MIIKLSPNSVDDIIQHFKLLSSDDIYNRFGNTLTTEALNSYIYNNIEETDWYGIYINKTLVAVLHIIEFENSIEFGCSVAPKYRKQGLATRLFEFTLKNAKKRNKSSVHIQCNSFNNTVIELAKRYNMKLERIDSEIIAQIEF